VFWEKRLQAIENKGSERRKERKETTKRLQAAANKRVGMFERPALTKGELWGDTRTPGVLYKEFGFA
jgi:hypothetical protein